MERSEPSLVPQWLKGASSGGVGGATHYSQASSNHQDESAFPLRPRSQPQVDYDAPRFPPSATSSSSPYYTAVRRGPGGGSTGVSDREIFSRGYTNFGRSTTYRSYDAGVDRSDRGDWERDRDWDRNTSSSSSSSRVLGGFEEREREPDNNNNNSMSAFRRPGLGGGGGPVPVSSRYEADLTAPLRRVHSMGSAARALENAEKKAAELPTAPPSNSGSLTSSMQKAAFERNFPSLGAQERGIMQQSSLGNLVVSSSRPSWQGSSTSHRMDGIRSAASSPGLPTGGSPGTTAPGGSNGEGWSSALAEAPATANGSTLVAPVASSPGAVIAPPTSSLANLSVTPNPPKMAEALVQHPPRVRTPPMYSVEKERVEERALLQSIRLIPRIPNTPGPVARDKKVVRPLDVVATLSTMMKPRLTLGSPSSQGSQALPYRPPASRDALKLGTGKVLARKVPIKEVGGGGGGPGGAPVSPVLKADASPLVSPLGLGPVTAATGLLNSSTSGAPRKQKQLLDRRAFPIPLPVSVPSSVDGGGRPKDGSSDGSSERSRPSAPTQNRVDFFNALRRKAGLAGTPTIVDKLDAAAAPPKEEELDNNAGEEECEENATAVQAEESGVENAVADDRNSSYPPLENGDRSHEESEDTAEELPVGEEVFGKENGEEPAAFDQLYEEDITFMVSLGWDQACVEETDALTQDEIDAFLNKRNELASNGAAGATSQKRSGNHYVSRRCQDLQVGSMGSETSGVTTSDSESEDDRHGK